MMTRERIKVGIQIAARVAELRRLAERTVQDYEADFAADNSLPAEHRRLRRVVRHRGGPPRSQGRALVRSFAVP
jgi:hypothetical protein